MKGERVSYTENEFVKSLYYLFHPSRLGAGVCVSGRRM